MRWATFRTSDGEERAGVLAGDALHSLDAGTSVLGLLGDDGERLMTFGERALSKPDAVFALGDVTLLAPVPRPPSIRDFYAFEGHARTARRTRGLDMDPDWYQIPVFYFSNPACVTGPHDDVAVPPGCAELDFELEVAAVVGAPGSDLEPGDAERHIAGFCVMNDWSARDLQRREMKLGLGPAKGKDFATTLGPFLVTPDELAPARAGKAYDLTMTASVNGREYSRGNLSDLYWSFGEMLAHASRGTRLVPGDVVGSGTCGGGCVLELAAVHGSGPYPWLRPGDAVTLEVERLGRIENRIVTR